MLKKPYFISVSVDNVKLTVYIGVSGKNTPISSVITGITITNYINKSIYYSNTPKNSVIKSLNVLYSVFVQKGALYFV